MTKNKLLLWLFPERCEFCRGLLRKHGDTYYGAVHIQDSIGGEPRRKAFVCNLCYSLFKRLSDDSIK